MIPQESSVGLLSESIWPPPHTIISASYLFAVVKGSMTLPPVFGYVLCRPGRLGSFRIILLECTSNICEVLEVKTNTLPSLRRWRKGYI